MSGINETSESYPLRMVFSNDFAVNVFYHKGGPPPQFDCWSFVSEGLNEHHNHKEIILTIKKEPNERDLPAMPFQFYKLLYDFASQGIVVGEGETTRFGANGFLGRPEIHGVAYVTAHLIEEGIEISTKRSYMYAVTMSKDEITIAMEYGAPRVLAMIGKQNKFYPYPLWSDRSRPSVVSASQQSLIGQSILAKTGYLRMMNCSATLARTENKILFKVPKNSSTFEQAISKIQQDSPIAFILEYDFTVNGHLVWDMVDPKALNAITPQTDMSGSHLSGSFIVLCPQQEKNRITVLEDGFAALLTNTSWLALLEALKTGSPLTIKSDLEGFDLELMWKQTEYHNPVDGMTYSALNGWQEYKPNNRGKEEVVPEVKQGLELTSVILLTAENQIAVSGMTPDKLAQYVKDINLVIGRVLGDMRGGVVLSQNRWKLNLQCELLNGVTKFSIKMEPTDKITKEEEQVLVCELGKLPTHSIILPVSFVVVFEIGNK